MQGKDSAANLSGTCTRLAKPRSVSQAAAVSNKTSFSMATAHLQKSISRKYILEQKRETMPDGYGGSVNDANFPGCSRPRTQ